MKCPNCSNRLRMVKTKSAVIDVCPECRGIWFDSGEIFNFMRTLSQSEKITPEDIKLFKPRKVISLYTLKEKDRFCSRCAVVMQKFNYASDSNVFLDKCSKCGGIWVDGAEIIQLASYLKENPQALAVGRNLMELNSMIQDADEEVSPMGYFIFAPRLVIPISDDIPLDKFPLITILLIALCTVFFVIQNFVASSSTNFIKEFGFVPDNFFSLSLITSMFVHADIFHFIFNMAFLWLFGDNVEDKFTRWGYLAFCIGGGLFANFLYTLFNWGSMTPLVGASGFISGIMGAYLIFYPQANITLFCMGRTTEVSALVYLAGWFVLQLIGAFTHEDPGIAWLAHIGGFVFGIIVAFIKKINNRVVEPEKSL